MFSFNFNPPIDPHAPVVSFKPKKESSKIEETPKSKKIKEEKIQEIKKLESPKIEEKPKSKKIKEKIESQKDDILDTLKEIKEEPQKVEEKPKRKKLIAGSDEAKEWAKNMREKREAKKLAKLTEEKKET